MDIDISDILADVSKSAAHSDNQSSQFVDPETVITDHQLLVRAWTSERCSPDLLPYPTSLIERVMNRIQAQISRIEDMASGISDPTSLVNRSNGYKTANNQNSNLTLSILQTDLSRTQFVVRSLLRQRLAKITKHAMLYLTELDADTKITLLSQPEVQFLRTHQALLSNFYEGSFLSAFPPALKRLDDSSGGVRMVEGPEQQDAVMVRCLNERWSNEEDLDRSDDVINELTMSRADVWVVRWCDVKSGVLNGDLELL